VDGVNKSDYLCLREGPPGTLHLNTDSEPRIKVVNNNNNLSRTDDTSMQNNTATSYYAVFRPWNRTFAMVRSCYMELELELSTCNVEASGCLEVRLSLLPTNSSEPAELPLFCVYYFSTFWLLLDISGFAWKPKNRIFEKTKKSEGR
jgi:hypothetical protein